MCRVSNGSIDRDRWDVVELSLQFLCRQRRYWGGQLAGSSPVDKLKHPAVLGSGFIPRALALELRPLAEAEAEGKR